MKTDYFIVDRVDSFPEKLESGYFYISDKYKTTAHLCACGCGEKVILPFEREIESKLHGWQIKLDIKYPRSDCYIVTVSPSILNRFECRSHYFIRDNAVEWC